MVCPKEAMLSPGEDLVCSGEANRDSHNSFYINVTVYQWAINQLILKPEDFRWSFI